MNLKKAIKAFSRVMKAKNVVPIYVEKPEKELLSEKIALISGGAGGIGFAIAEVFIKHGCKVIISGSNEKKLQNASEKLGNNCKYIVINLLDIQSMPEKVEQASKLFDSNGKIDILVNSAGNHCGQRFGEITEDVYDKVMDVNLKGTFFLTQYVSNLMVAKKIKGHILNVSSASALKPAWTPYEISKWGIRGFTKGSANSLIKKGIVVNAIAPGPVATKMLGRDEDDTLYIEPLANPAQRYATPIEIAQLAVYMVSDMCNLVVGDTFYITGGTGTVAY